MGKRLRLDNDLYTIVGVMPPGFHNPGRTVESDVDVWASCGFAGDPFPPSPPRSVRIVPGALGRLKPDLTIARAQVQLDAFAAHLREQYPTDYPAKQGWNLRLVSIQEDLVGNVRTELLALFGAVSFVLLIACVNLATFLLARASQRQREVAIRLAMGAGRGRLIRQLLTENVMLAAIAGTLAISMLFLFKNSLLTLAPSNLPRLNEVSIDWHVLLFAFAISIVSGVLFSLAPALQAANPAKSPACEKEAAARARVLAKLACPASSRIGNSIVSGPFDRSRPAGSQLPESSARESRLRSAQRPNSQGLDCRSK